jgi:beta-phosphoglucomutase-like phosphatase (HAD superfamily)
MLLQEHGQLAADELPGEPSNPFQHARALAFDAAGIIYDATLWRRNVWQVVWHLGLHVDYDRFFSLWDERYADCVNSGRREFAEAFEAFLLGAGLSWAQIDEVEGATRSSRLHLCRPKKPLPGVVRAIQELAADGLDQLAFVDAPEAGSEIAACFKAWGLSSLERVITSLDVAAAQPGAACFRAMLELLGHEPDHVAYVSQNGQNLNAAKCAGLLTVALGGNVSQTADGRIGSIEKLLRLIPSRRHSEASGLPAGAAARKRGDAPIQPECSKR